MWLGIIRDMVEVARLPGEISIRVYHNEGSHHQAHVHVVYPDGKSAVVALNSELQILAGEFRNGRERRRIKSWIEDHFDELEGRWNLARAGQTIDRLD